MENIGDLLKGLSSLAWPVIIIIILLKFSSAISRVVESARLRKFTIKVGGNELTMEEASKLQINQINDLRNQVLEIQKKLKETKSGEEIQEVLDEDKVIKEEKVSSILWVDDRPKNNSYEMAQLKELGIDVQTALSTSEALAMFDRNKYDRVISDMGRQEDDRYNSTAGIDLVSEIRKIDQDIPVVIYCSQRGADRYRTKALGEGATEITGSTTVLFDALKLN